MRARVRVEVEVRVRVRVEVEVGVRREHCEGALPRRADSLRFQSID